MPSIHLNGLDYEYKLTLDSRRTIAIQLRPDSQIIIKAPHGTTQAYIDKFIQSHKLWLYKKLMEQKQQLLKKPSHKHTFLDGDTIYYLGAGLELIIRHVAKLKEPQVNVTENHLYIHTPYSPSNSTSNQLIIRKFLLTQANQILRERYATLATRFGLQSPPPLVINNTKSKWGSCKSRGPIALSQKLIHYSPHAIDAVITHELCHITHPHHGPSFYRLLGKLYPSYKTADAELKDMSRCLI